MGDPKRQRKKYQNPRFSWSKSNLDAELNLIGEYGLRNKRELRRHHFMLLKYRKLARHLLAKTQTERVALENQILNKLISLKIIPENSSLDHVLDLSIRNILERRLQTLVFRTGIAKTSHQARQMITHGHITVQGMKVTSPSYLVNTDDEQDIKCLIVIPFVESSVVNNSDL